MKFLKLCRPKPRFLFFEKRVIFQVESSEETGTGEDTKLYFDELRCLEAESNTIDGQILELFAKAKNLLADLASLGEDVSNLLETYNELIERSKVNPMNLGHPSFRNEDLSLSELALCLFFTLNDLIQSKEAIQDRRLAVLKAITNELELEI